MMPSSLNQIITQIVYILPALLVSVTFHELAHGYVAYKLGDPTAKKMGRLTLNPIKHLDPMGTAMLIFFRFGWAKPVPYNPNYFKNRKQGTFLVAVAG
ncbi:MAG TPA: site-2 protease family protein, partial [Eubacteriaceae bacterium]|nr:site-2 protease family protein [Eubacteriaceae bacterium]